MFRKFQFEKDFYDRLRCIPFSTRFKLDISGVKLSLKSWNLFSEDERQKFCEMPVQTEIEISIYRGSLVALLDKLGEPVKFLETLHVVSENMPWASASPIPFDLQTKLSQLGLNLRLEDWKKLDDLQRFVLFKLSQGKHDHANLGPALEEFLKPV